MQSQKNKVSMLLQDSESSLHHICLKSTSAPTVVMPIPRHFSCTYAEILLSHTTIHCTAFPRFPPGMLQCFTVPSKRIITAFHNGFCPPVQQHTHKTFGSEKIADVCFTEITRKPWGHCTTVLGLPVMMNIPELKQNLLLSLRILSQSYYCHLGSGLS